MRRAHTDRNGLHLRARQSIDDLSDASDAQNVFNILLRRSVPHRPNTDVACAIPGGLRSLFWCICRDSYDRTLWEELLGELGGHVRLANVDAVGLDSYCYVDSVD